jgi:hypothetical protein
MVHVVFGTTILLGMAYLIISLITYVVRGTFQAADVASAKAEGAQNYVSILVSKTKRFINNMGGDGTKTVNDAQNTAEEIAKKTAEKGQEMTESGEEVGILIGILMVALGSVLAAVATFKQDGGGGGQKLLGR